jgi:uncharacterized damage-inducible protein DinB
MTISQSIKEAWEVNEEMNRILLEYLTLDMLNIQTPNEEWSVAGYLAHLTVSKKWWGKHINQEKVSHLPSLFSKVQDEFIASTDLTQIKDVFEQTSKAILEIAETATSKGNLPYASLEIFLIQQMIHDGHHRGQILLMLRNAGYTPPSDDDFWGVWWPDQQL